MLLFCALPPADFDILFGAAHSKFALQVCQQPHIIEINASEIHIRGAIGILISSSDLKETMGWEISLLMKERAFD
jgi:hypothetical protein